MVEVFSLFYRNWYRNNCTKRNQPHYNISTIFISQHYWLISNKWWICGDLNPEWWVRSPAWYPVSLQILEESDSCSFCSRLCSTLNGFTGPVSNGSVKGRICTIHSDANNHFPNSLNFVGVNTPPTGQSSMVVMLGLEPRLGTNLVLLVYKTSDANITSHDHSYNRLYKS